MRNIKRFEKTIKAYYKEKERRIKKDVTLTDRQKQNRIKKNAQELENKIKWLYDLENAPDLRKIEIVTDWKRSSVWGWNPHCRVYVNDSYAGEGKASGCGYDKQSAAASRPLSDSRIITKWLIHNYSKIKDAYAVETYGGYPHLDVSAKGLSTIYSMFVCYYGHDYDKLQHNLLHVEREDYDLFQFCKIK